MVKIAVEDLGKQMQLMEFWQRGAISHWHQGHKHLMFNGLTFKGHYSQTLSPHRHTDVLAYISAPHHTHVMRHKFSAGLSPDVGVCVCVEQECELCWRGSPEEDEGVRGPDRRSALRHPDRFGEQRDWQQGNVLACASSCCAHWLSHTNSPEKSKMCVCVCMCEMCISVQKLKH